MASAASFALQSICVRIGQRTRHRDDGHFMSVAMNAILVLFVLPFSSFGPWSWTALTAFVLAGIGTTWLGRGTALRAIRLIGPTRQSGFLISAPIFTAIGGWTLLDEPVSPLQLAGGLLVLGGLAVLVRSKVAAEPLATAGEAPEPHVAALEEPGGGVRVIKVTPDARRRGYSIALLSAVSFGLGYVMRKWGLEHYPNAVFGAFVGAVMSLALILGTASVRGRLSGLVQDNLRDIPLWFVAGGLLSGLGLLFGFSAFLHLPAWAVAVLKGTQGLWTLLFSYLFIREEERLGPDVALAVLMTFAGITVIGLAS